MPLSVTLAACLVDIGLIKDRGINGRRLPPQLLAGFSGDSARSWL